MNKQQAQELIKETFETPFNKERFIHLIKNLLNQIDEDSFTYQGNLIPDGFKPYISKYERIGKYNDGKNRIDLLIVHLKREKSIERARTMQRNFIAGYLQGKYGSSNEKEAAIVAFLSPGEADWRFSLVKMDYRFEESKTGKIRVKEEFTPAKRWSFLVGCHEASHTAQSRLINFLSDDEHNPTLEQLEEAFNIETVTKEFFNKYRSLFIQVKEALDKIFKSDSRVKTDFEAKSVDTVNFAKKLLGQIVFLYFLQKKGWFGVERDAEWGSGSKQFLRELFIGKHGTYQNFFNDILEPLFYEALRIDRRHDDDYYSRFNCKIPFLNGGLFDPINNYDWVHTDILLPNNFFSNNTKTKEGDTVNGILDIFDRYNFTVKEDEPLEKEVAIDPELLGKAYEKFNAIRPDNYEEYIAALNSGKKGAENKFNKKFGVYYTPREIVHYMCQQSLINYLHTELNSGNWSFQKIGDSQTDTFGNEVKTGQSDLTIEYSSQPHISKEDIETLIKFGEQVGETEAAFIEKEQRITEGKQKSTKLQSKLPESIRQNAERIDKALSEITVCDPAVGSGAFPVGMMHEIVKTRNVLSIFIKESHRTIYNFKRQCIEKSLYGVDIDSGAVEIAKLRLWLSLVVDEEDIKSIKALPNLDYRIVCGNSLLGYPYVPKGLERIEKLKQSFFSETRPSEKKKLKELIDNTIYNIFKDTEKTLGYTVNFDFKINFSEVYHGKNGFDVVIANPPYVRVDDISTHLKKQLKKIFKSATGKYDLYYLFIEKSISLIRDDRMLVFITPNKYCAASYGKILRELILSSMGNCEILSTSRLEVFEEAANYPIISIFKKSQTTKQFLVREALDINHLSHSTNSIYKLNHIQFKQLPNSIIPINVSQEKLNLVLRLLKKYSRLKHYFSISEGLRIPAKYEQKKDADFQIVKQYQFEKWTFVRDGSKISLRNLKRVISENSKRFKKIMGNKILIAEDALHITATIDLEKNIPQGGVYFGTVIEKTIDLKTILALLNSKLLSAIYEFLYSGMHMGGGYLRYRTDFLEELPFVLDLDKKELLLNDLVDQILIIIKDEDYLKNPRKQAKVKVIEKEIDQMVYQLYGLTKEEIKLLEGEND